MNNADKQHGILLSVCGVSTNQQIRKLVAPAVPTNKSFTELVELVQTHTGVETGGGGHWGHVPPPWFLGGEAQGGTKTSCTAFLKIRPRFALVIEL